MASIWLIFSGVMVTTIGNQDAEGANVDKTALVDNLLSVH